jgi:putative transposase
MKINATNATVRKTFKYRLYPTPDQAVALMQTVGLCNWLYNTALEQRRYTWRARQKSLTYYDQKAELPDLKTAFPEFAMVHSQVTQDVIKRVDTAFQRFFVGLTAHRKVGYPRFKAATQYNSFTYPQYGNGVNVLANGQLRLSKIGEVAVAWSRPMVGEIKTVTLVHTADTWYVCFSCANVPVEPHVPTGQTVGIDLGLKVFLVTDQGAAVENPRYYRRAQSRLKKCQQELARRPKRPVSMASGVGSAGTTVPAKVTGKNRRKSLVKLQRAAQGVSRQRADLHHKTARWLVNNFDVICVEQLRVAAMARNRHLAKSIYDAGWAAFLTILAFKAASAGVSVVRVPAAYTTQTCSFILPNGQQCGTRVKKSLAVRTHICPSCGYVADRDHNAARNIKQEGLRRLAHETVPSGGRERARFGDPLGNRGA